MTSERDDVRTLREFVRTATEWSTGAEEYAHELDVHGALDRIEARITQRADDAQDIREEESMTNTPHAEPRPPVLFTCANDCAMCSGEYCEQHPFGLCQCDAITRHTPIPDTRPRPGSGITLNPNAPSLSIALPNAPAFEAVRVNVSVDENGALVPDAMWPETPMLLPEADESTTAAYIVAAAEWERVKREREQLRVTVEHYSGDRVIEPEMTLVERACSLIATANQLPSEPSEAMVEEVALVMAARNQRVVVDAADRGHARVACRAALAALRAEVEGP